MDPMNTTSEKKYSEPEWRWWQNQYNTWNVTATFTADDGTTVSLDAPLIHYDEKNSEYNSYIGEVDFNGKTWLSPEYKVPKEAPVVGVDVAPGPDQTATQTVDENGKVIPQPLGKDEEPAAEPTEAHNMTVQAVEPGEEQAEEVKVPTEAEMLNALRQVTEGVRIMENIWLSASKEYQVNEGHIRQLYKFNEDNRDPMPEGLSKEEQQNWDHFNGLKKLTDEDIEKIFGAEHPIIGVQLSQTLDRINTVVNDFFNWTYALNSYKEIYNAYREYIEAQEEANINALKDIAAKEEDPEKRAKMEDAIKTYYYRKHLGFLGVEQDEATKKRIATAWADSRKLEYWLKRSREKLTKLKISTKVILEISKFEVRFLDYKYHRISNVLLTYFLNIATYCKPDDKNDTNRNMVVCMVFALDNIIRNAAPPEVKDEVMKNILSFEDQMLAYIPDPNAGKEPETSESPTEEKPTEDAPQPEVEVVNPIEESEE